MVNGRGPRGWLIGAWVGVMICIPIVRWALGDGVLHWGVMLGVVFQAAAVLATLVFCWGARETLRVGAIIVSAAWVMEWIGSHTGIPFGAYYYTALLRPQLGDVPLVIPLAWLMMLPAAWAVADFIVASHPQKMNRGPGRWRFVFVSALAFTAWDLFLDPQMVAWGYWVWEQPGVYFGIPGVNFLGWFISAALVTLMVRPRFNPSLPLLVIYTITWALQSMGLAFFWGMVGPALAGFLGMGAFVLLAWRAQLRHSNL